MKIKDRIKNSKPEIKQNKSLILIRISRFAKTHRDLLLIIIVFLFIGISAFFILKFSQRNTVENNKVTLNQESKDNTPNNQLFDNSQPSNIPSLITREEGTNATLNSAAQEQPITTTPKSNPSSTAKIRLSHEGICYQIGDREYRRLHDVPEFNSLEECIKAGGHKP